MKTEQSPKIRTAFVAGGALVLALVVMYVTPYFAHRPRGRIEHVPAFYIILVQAKIVTTSFNFFVLIALLYSYMSIYLDLPNKYTRSMLILCVALLLYSISGNPLTHIWFGFHPDPNVGAFAFVPDIFVGVAVVVLFYQSQT